MMALAKESIFSREELIKGSLSGQKNTEVLDHEKTSYFKPLVRSRISDKYHLLSLQKLTVPGTTHRYKEKTMPDNIIIIIYPQLILIFLHTIIIV